MDVDLLLSCGTFLSHCTDLNEADTVIADGRVLMRGRRVAHVDVDAVLAEPRRLWGA
jgi:hypothetical protein